MKKLLVVIIACTRALLAEAQELSVYQSYLIIPELHNPAYMGALQCTKLSAADKHQWLGIDDAPNQQILSANFRYEPARLRKIGFGLTLLNDQNGANRATGGRAAYAYHAMLVKSRGHWLSLALSGSFFNMRVEKSGFVANSMDDPLIAAASRKGNRFDANAGILYYSRVFAFGLSCYQLIPQKSIADNDYTRPILGIAHADYAITWRKIMKFVPNARLVVEKGEHISADLGIKCELKDKYWIALSQRSYAGNFGNTAQSLLLHLGAQYKGFSFAYSADFGLTGLRGSHYASHEIGIGYSFCKPDCGCTH